jgi:hypothetical protein
MSDFVDTVESRVELPPIRIRPLAYSIESTGELTSPDRESSAEVMIRPPAIQNQWSGPSSHLSAS